MKPRHTLHHFAFSVRLSLALALLLPVASVLIYLNHAHAAGGHLVTTAANSLNVPALTPNLGNYAATSMSLGANATISPDAAPANTVGINVSTSTNFQGTFSADPGGGSVRVTNAHPAGTYNVTVKAFNGSATATRTFTLTVQTGTACNGASVFTNAADATVAGNTYSVAIGDFNNDGNQDIATASPGSNLVAIRLGNGLGGFSGTTNIDLGTGTESVAIGDFNNDGKQDFAAANVYTNAVSIRLGNGSGGFTSPLPSSLSVGSNPGAIAIGDFNNDGKQDFAVANFSSSSVSIRLGDGLGHFSTAPDVGVDSEPGAIAIGDFNHDGKPDFAVANRGSNTVSIRLGNGAGGFISPSTPEVSLPSYAFSIAIGDFNNDGNQDFATANPISHTVSIRLGDGSGGFTGTTNIDMGTAPAGVAIGDFNNDGNQDFATANGVSSDVSIRLGDGLGGFSGTANFGAGSGPDSLAIGDFNHDGKQDLVVANSSGIADSIRLGRCDPPPTIAAAAGLSRLEGAPATNSQIATVTDDGGNGAVSVTVTSANPANGVTISNIVNTGGTITADIAAANGATSASFTLQASDGASTVTDTLNVTVIPLPKLGNYADTSLGLGASTTITPDAVPANTTGINVSTSTNFKGILSADSATGVVRVTNASPAGTYTMTLTAFGSASITKTFTLTVPAGTACNGAPFFTNAADSPVGITPWAVAVGDFNNDGKQDFAVANVHSNSVSIRLGDGLGGFSGNTEVSALTPYSIAIGDFNNDGNQDFATVNGLSSDVSIRLGDGLGGFSTASDVSVGLYPVSLAIGDFNNDGKQDLAVADNGGVSIRFGDGSGGFSGSTEVGGGHPYSLAIGDFNNDGNQDLAIGSHTVQVLLGDGLGGFSGGPTVGLGVFEADTIAIGDFNNDGRQDLAVVSNYFPQVLIRLGDGSGGFSGGTNLQYNPNDSLEGGIAIGDFNNDGAQDLVTLDPFGVSIRLGDGSGGFSGSTGGGVSARARAVAIGDFNNDGKQDFVVVKTSSFEDPTNVSIRLGACNPAPMIAAAAGLSRPEGGPASNSQIATVADDGGDGSVAVTVTSANPSNGVTISNIVNSAGNITADIGADCTATDASFTLQVSDGNSTATATLDIKVSGNTAPTLNYTNPSALFFNGSTTVTPAAAGDNG
ncbi:MAG TPA: FG-GAP-like repeat-containing protein, partial [Pyrinomonadaceae bacterium]|nr:FG-GAP-like repeat-containing protein [Pyrinomonadaceae bacterium]